MLTGPDAVLVRRDPLRLRDPDRGDLLQRRRVDPDEARGDAYPQAVERVDDIPSGGKVGVPRRVHRRRIHLDQALQRGHPHRAAPRRDITEDVVAGELQKSSPTRVMAPVVPGPVARAPLAISRSLAASTPPTAAAATSAAAAARAAGRRPHGRSVARDELRARPRLLKRRQLVADHGIPSRMRSSTVTVIDLLAEQRRQPLPRPVQVDVGGSGAAADEVGYFLDGAVPRSTSTSELT